MREGIYEELVTQLVVQKIREIDRDKLLLRMSLSLMADCCIFELLVTI